MFIKKGWNSFWGLPFRYSDDFLQYAFLIGSCNSYCTDGRTAGAVVQVDVKTGGVVIEEFESLAAAQRASIVHAAAFTPGTSAPDSRPHTATLAQQSDKLVWLIAISESVYRRCGSA